MAPLVRTGDAFYFSQPRIRRPPDREPALDKISASSMSSTQDLQSNPRLNLQSQYKSPPLCIRRLKRRALTARGCYTTIPEVR